MLEALCKPELLISPFPKLFAFFSLFILTLLLVFCWYQWKLSRAYKMFPSVRLDIRWLFTIIVGRYPKGVPLTNFVFQEFANIGKRFQDEGVFVLWLLRPLLFVYNEDFNKTFFNETAAINKGLIYEMMKDLWGNGLLISKEEIWKVHRKLVNPAFNVGVLKGKMKIFNQSGHNLEQKLLAVVDQPIENILHILKYCAFNVMSESVLGLSMNDAKCGTKVLDFIRNIDRAAEFFVKRLPFPWLRWNFLLPIFPSGRKYIKRVHDIHNFTDEIIEELKSIEFSQKEEINLDDEKEIPKSFAQILIKQHLQDPSFTTYDVRDNLISIMVAGFDTTSTTLMWCFYLLGHHPKEQEKAFKEIVSVVPEGDVTYDDLAKLKYLDCVIKETLRMYPAVPIYSRKVKKDVQCGKYTVPKDTELVFNLFSLHRNPHIYPQPEKFDPERFVDTSMIRPWSFRPFAEGYRYCIGKKFAMMEMKVLLVHILRRFKVASQNTIPDSDLRWGIVLTPTKKPRILFTNR